MTTATALTDPDAHRLEVREASYPNRQAEDAAIRTTDEAIFNRVRVLESKLMADAADLTARGDQHTTAAADLVAAVRDEVLTPLTDEHADTDAIVDRYQSLRAQITQQIAELERADGEAEFLLSKVADPYATYKSVVTKFSALLTGRDLGY